jgi:hypothetical protein
LLFRYLRHHPFMDLLEILKKYTIISKNNIEGI